MLHTVLKLAHVAAVILWVGGMVFAHFFLRPALQAQEGMQPPQRLALMHAVLQRFFGAVLWAVLVVVGSGLAMIAQAAGGEGFEMPPHWTAMATIGVVMAAIFGHIRFALFPRLARAVAARDWPQGGAAMNAIRRWVSVNLALGIAVVLIAYLRWPG
jgi:uncharacterized membrane protein